MCILKLIWMPHHEELAGVEDVLEHMSHDTHAQLCGQLPQELLLVHSLNGPVRVAEVPVPQNNPSSYARRMQVGLKTILGWHQPIFS